MQKCVFESCGSLSSAVRHEDVVDAALGSMQFPSRFLPRLVPFPPFFAISIALDQLTVPQAVNDLRQPRYSDIDDPAGLAAVEEDGTIEIKKGLDEFELRFVFGWLERVIVASTKKLEKLEEGEGSQEEYVLETASSMLANLSGEGCTSPSVAENTHGMLMVFLQRPEKSRKFFDFPLFSLRPRGRMPTTQHRPISTWRSEIRRSSAIRQATGHGEPRRFSPSSWRSTSPSSSRAMLRRRDRHCEYWSWVRGQDWSEYLLRRYWRRARGISR